MAQNSKKNLLIVGYYALADGFQTCANYLQKKYNILFFPLLYYQNNHLNIVQNVSKYINGEPLEKYTHHLIPNNQKIDIVFLWYHNYFCSDFTHVRYFELIKENVHKEVVFIGYNWDPLCPTEEIKPSKIQFISSLNAYISGDILEINYLKSKGLTNLEFCPSGFDPTVSSFIQDTEYECDVSIVCTNLYTNHLSFPLEYVRLNRKKLVDGIYENRHKIKFHIYGPQFLSNLYPDCYQGYIEYKNCPKVFSNSKINLCIHAVSYNSQGQYLYFSERLPQILGCQGLLYCETEYKELLIPNVNYILADPLDPVNQIEEILTNYESYTQLKKNGYLLAIKHLTWQNLVDKIQQIEIKNFI